MESGRDHELNDATEGTLPPVVATFRLGEESAAERSNDQQREERKDNAIVTMGKQNGEDLDQDAQERMLKEDSTAKIAIEKDEKDEKATEVRICSWTVLLLLDFHFAILDSRNGTCSQG